MPTFAGLEFGETMIKIRSLLLVLALTSIAAMPAQAQLFGPSDEQKAHETAQDAKAVDQDSKIADQDNKINALTGRVRDLEESLRQATGRNEALQNQVNQLSQQIDRQQRDLEYRLCVITARQLGTSADPDAGGINCTSAAGQAAASTPGDRVPSGAVALPPPSGSLGTLPLTAPSSPQLGAGGVPQARFEAAMNLLGRNQMADARAAFRAFADSYPDNDLAPQAVYWVGVIAFNENDYANAARTFAEGIQKYPTSTRGPDSMLKLGQSLIALNQKTEGCKAFAAIKEKYPTASASVLSQATVERRNAACK